MEGADGGVVGDGVEVVEVEGVVEGVGVGDEDGEEEQAERVIWGEFQWGGPETWDGGSLANPKVSKMTQISVARRGKSGKLVEFQTTE